MWTLQEVRVTWDSDTPCAAPQGEGLLSFLGSAKLVTPALSPEPARALPVPEDTKARVRGARLRDRVLFIMHAPARVSK
ncbi:hypothetical protein NDU88_004767 [Pleurodeles waltl]|uniref:Uncharacterized protein n=1 Tax=Pleurodeles waltl TaxID=8319 RepID=A0AAV7PF06_PLEWA|nr:hypothetical protein NDU88_004767 [Pleurodeles waltl]